MNPQKVFDSGGYQEKDWPLRQGVDGSCMKRNGIEWKGHPLHSFLNLKILSFQTPSINTVMDHEKQWFPSFFQFFVIFPTLLQRDTLFPLESAFIYSSSTVLENVHHLKQRHL